MPLFGGVSVKNLSENSNGNTAPFGTPDPYAMGAYGQQVGAYAPAGTTYVGVPMGAYGQPLGQPKPLNFGTLFGGAPTPSAPVPTLTGGVANTTAGSLPLQGAIQNQTFTPNLSATGGGGGGGGFGGSSNAQANNSLSISTPMQFTPPNFTPAQGIQATPPGFANQPGYTPHNPIQNSGGGSLPFAMPSIQGPTSQNISGGDERSPQMAPMDQRSTAPNAGGGATSLTGAIEKKEQMRPQPQAPTIINPGAQAPMMAPMGGGAKPMPKRGNPFAPALPAVDKGNFEDLARAAQFLPGVGPLVTTAQVFRNAQQKKQPFAEKPAVKPVQMPAAKSEEAEIEALTKRLKQLKALKEQKAMEPAPSPTRTALRKGGGGFVPPPPPMMTDGTVPPPNTLPTSVGMGATPRGLIPPPPVDTGIGMMTPGGLSIGNGNRPMASPPPAQPLGREQTPQMAPIDFEDQSPTRIHRKPQQQQPAAEQQPQPLTLPQNEPPPPTMPQYDAPGVPTAKDIGGFTGMSMPPPTSDQHVTQDRILQLNADASRQIKELRQGDQGQYVKEMRSQARQTMMSMNATRQEIMRLDPQQLQIQADAYARQYTRGSFWTQVANAAAGSPVTSRGGRYQAAYATFMNNAMAQRQQLEQQYREQGSLYNDQLKGANDAAREIDQQTQQILTNTHAVQMNLVNNANGIATYQNGMMSNWNNAGLGIMNNRTTQQHNQMEYQAKIAQLGLDSRKANQYYALGLQHNQLMQQGNVNEANRITEMVAHDLDQYSLEAQRNSFQAQQSQAYQNYLKAQQDYISGAQTDRTKVEAARAAAMTQISQIEEGRKVIQMLAQGAGNVAHGLMQGAGQAAALGMFP